MHLLGVEVRFSRPMQPFWMEKWLVPKKQMSLGSFVVQLKFDTFCKTSAIRIDKEMTQIIVQHFKPEREYG